MNDLTPEEIEESRKIAREGSWLCSLFQEFNIKGNEKQEILKRVFAKSKEQGNK